MNLQESIAKFRQPVYSPIKRSNETYSATAGYVQRNLARLVEEYHDNKNNQQVLRLIRDDMDKLLRRYHQYCIEQNFGAHYVQDDLDEKGIFEHMVPNSTVRDLLLHGVITAEQACNMPTCKLSKENDVKLTEAGWASKTPDIYNFWQRYTNCFSVEGNFSTYDGVAVDPNNWTLDKHFEYFLNR